MPEALSKNMDLEPNMRNQATRDVFMSNQASGNAHISVPSKSPETAQAFMPDQAAVEASPQALSSSV